MEKSESSSIRHQDDKKLVHQGMPRLGLQPHMPFPKPGTDLPYPSNHIPNRMRYSPSPFSVDPPSISPTDDLLTQKSHLQNQHGHNTYSPVPEFSKFFLSQQYNPGMDILQKTTSRSVGTRSVISPSPSSFSLPSIQYESDLDEYEPMFQHQLPQRLPYYGVESVDNREQGFPRRTVESRSDSFHSSYESLPSPSWESQSSDDRPILHRELGLPFAESFELENPFRPSEPKARSDAESSPFLARQLFRETDTVSPWNRMLRPGSMGTYSPSGQTDPEIGYHPSIYAHRPSFDHTLHVPRNKMFEDLEKTPTKLNRLEEPKDRNWSFENRPSSVPDRARPAQRITNSQKRSKTETKSLSEVDVAKEHPLVDVAKVKDKLAEQRKRIQDQFKAQVAKKLEDSKKIILPTKVANEAYARIDRLGLLTHPALRLGLIHHKPDTRGIHEKFLELVQGVTIEEYSQMQMHIQLSERLLKDINMSLWNINLSKGKVPVPVQSHFSMMGIAMPEPYGPVVHSGSDSDDERNFGPSKVTHGEFKGAGKPGSLSDQPEIRKIQLETGDFDQSYVGKGPMPTHDPTFRVAPEHWTPPKGYEINFPSASRWEEIAIIKTYHQALIVQQHLYLLMVYIGTPFTMDWITFTTAKEREAMIVKAFSVTMKTPSDDGHLWVDREWSVLSEEEKRLKLTSEPLNPPPPPKAQSFQLSSYREIDETDFPIPFSRDMYRGITIHISDPPVISESSAANTMAQYSLFCHEIESYLLARDPELILRLISGCLISPNLGNFPEDSENFSEDYFYKPAMSIKDVEKVYLGPQLEEGLPFMAGLPLGPNLHERVKADRTFFYSTFCYNLLLCWRDYRDEKVWYYGNGTPDRYDPNDPPKMLGHPRSMFPKGEKWTEGAEIEKHVDQLQRMCDILNMGIYIEKWVPEDEEDEKPVDKNGDIFQRRKKIGEDEPGFGQGLLFTGPINPSEDKKGKS